MMAPFSQDVLKSFLHYNPETGVFTRAVSITSAKSGGIAGSIKRCGYRYISVCGHQYAASRLAWLYMTGLWPTAQIDHKNRVRCDDRWVNIREATRSQNQANRSSSRNTSGVIGVTWHAQSKKWQAQISHDRKHHYLGIFETLDAARAAYCAASIKFHGEFGVTQS